MLHAGALGLAWLLDRFGGEPRNAWHPVAWFGALAAPLGSRICGWPPAAAFVGGAVSWMVLLAAVLVLALLVEAWLVAMPPGLAVLLLGLALKPAFAWRMLHDEVQAVDVALVNGLADGRRQVARLCSRDVQLLDETGVREAAISTLAENLNDSVVAPLFWFVVAGLPGAWGWRAVNTLDAMWGYRDHREWMGKWAARADDVLGLIPARIAALLLAWWRVPLADVQREARCMPSPNGGWPMAAMALRLGVRLSRPGSYVLNAAGSRPGARALASALSVASRAAILAFVVALVAILLRRGFAPGWSLAVEAFV